MSDLHGHNAFEDVGLDMGDDRKKGLPGIGQGMIYVAKSFFNPNGDIQVASSFWFIFLIIGYLIFFCVFDVFAVEGALGINVDRT